MTVGDAGTGKPLSVSPTVRKNLPPGLARPHRPRAWLADAACPPANRAMQTMLTCLTGPAVCFPVTGRQMRLRMVGLDWLLHHPQKTENRNHWVIPS